MNLEVSLVKHEIVKSEFSNQFGVLYSEETKNEVVERKPIPLLSELWDDKTNSVMQENKKGVTTKTSTWIRSEKTP